MIFNNKATLSLVLLFGVQHTWCMDDARGHLIGGVHADAPFVSVITDDEAINVIEYAQPLDADIVRIAYNHAPVRIQRVTDKMLNYPNKVLRRRKYLFTGEPGTGKTTLAQAMAQFAGWPCVIVPIPELPNEFQDSAAAGLTRFIDPIIEKDGKCVIVLDEITHLTDSYKKNKNNPDRTATTLWWLLDKCNNRNNIVIIGTTNDDSDLPAPLKNRFGNGIIKIEMPSLEARTSLINYLFRNPIQVGKFDQNYINMLAKKSNKKSLRDIVGLYQDAADIAELEDRDIEHNDIDALIAEWRSWYHPQELWQSVESSRIYKFCKPALPNAFEIIKFSIPVALQLVALWMNYQQMDFQCDNTNTQINMQKQSFDLQQATTTTQFEMQQEGLKYQKQALDLQKGSFDTQVGSNALQAASNKMQSDAAAMQRNQQTIQNLNNMIAALQSFK